MRQPPSNASATTERMATDIYEAYDRVAEEYLATHGLRVDADRLPMVREILIGETRHEADTYAGRGFVPGNTGLMAICAAQLWHAGVVEDALLVHRARRTSMDATGAIDAHLLLGAGVARTRAFCAALGTDEARLILDDIAGVENEYEPDRYAAALAAWYETD